jgi:hypothetical protein
VTAVQEADEWFFAGDESPKKGHAVFGTAVTCVKDGKVQNVPLNFSVVRDGQAATEGQRIVDDLTTWDSSSRVEASGGISGGKGANFFKCKGGISDNAAAAVAAQEYAIKVGVANMKADALWQEMDPAQRKAAVDIKITRCANHGTHKVCEASVKNETELCSSSSWEGQALAIALQRSFWTSPPA